MELNVLSLQHNHDNERTIEARGNNYSKSVYATDFNLILYTSLEVKVVYLAETALILTLTSESIQPKNIKKKSKS